MKHAPALYNEFDPFAAAWLRELIREGHIRHGEVDGRSIVDLRPADLAGQRQVHLFAGIGVWSHALRRAGWADDRSVWTASFPCQPFSVAGKGRGAEDDRHLWPVGFGLIRECRPHVIIGEQVSSPDGLGWFDAVSLDLEGEGYAVGALDTCAAGVGAPHIRQRLYWCAVRLADATMRREPGGLWERGSTERPEVAIRGHGASRRVADADSGQCDGLAGGEGCISDWQTAGRKQGDGGASGFGATGWLADAHGRNASAEGLQCGGEHGQQPQDGGVGSLADAACIRRGEERSDAGRFALGDRAQGFATGLVDGGGDHRPGPTNGFWRDADWLGCRDGKWRPVEPGTFPLAHGATARVGRLRGYGNALNAEQATVFVQSVMAHIDEARAAA